MSHARWSRSLSFPIVAGVLASFACAGSRAVRGDAAQPSPRCGLGAGFHAGRRAALAKELEDGILLVRGLPPTRDYAAFRQDKTFWYLTGVESPDAALLVDLSKKREALFLPKANAMLEMWEGEQWDAKDAWVREATGIEDVRAEDQLLATLEEWLGGKKRVVWIAKTPHVALGGCHDRARPFDRNQAEDPLDGRPSREQALGTKLQERFGVEVKDCSEVLARLRLVKTGEEVAAMRAAGRSGAAAMAEAIRSTRPGLREDDLEALMSFVQRREGATGPAYHAIVGSGPNALVLHYSALGRTMGAAEMLLIDYAPEHDGYTSDITRSWPTDGKFTPRMAEIYDAVLAAQKAGIAAVKPGGRIADVERACREVLDQRGMGKLVRHGACHLIGLEVHDVGDLRAPLVPGVAFTVEPGVYDPASGIGVRIEDVVVVTPDGCEVLTSGVPKEREEVAALVAERGLLDAEAARAVPAAGRPSR